MRTGIKLRGVRRIAAASMVSVTLAPLMFASTSPSGAVSGATIAWCAPSQIVESLAQGTPSSSGVEYSGTVFFQDVGAVCALRESYIDFQPREKPFGPAIGFTAIPSVALLGRIILAPGEAARAVVAIGSVSNSAIKESCHPQMATAVEVPSPYSGWPSYTFPLPRAVALCVGPSSNIAAGFLLRTSVTLRSPSALISGAVEPCLPSVPPTVTLVSLNRGPSWVDASQSWAPNTHEFPSHRDYLNFSFRVPAGSYALRSSSSTSPVPRADRHITVTAGTHVTGSIATTCQ